MVGLASAEIYKIERADGSIEYTDQKPTEVSDKISEIELPELENSNDTRAITRGYDSVLRDEERARAKNVAKEKRRQKILAPLRKKLRKAKLALSKGKQKREGDYIRNVNGGSRLSPSYSSRVASLEAAVKAAETELKKRY